MTIIQHVLLATVTVITGAAAAGPSLEQRLGNADRASATFVITATVTGIGTSALDSVKPSPNTIVVRVEKVQTKPAGVALVTGDTVTIETRNTIGLKVGDQVVFYATGWIYDKTLAVREIAHETPPATGVVDSVLNLPQVNAHLIDRVRSADMVVTGRVIRIQPASQPEPPKGVSEHNPEWMEAVISVSTAIKNGSNDQTIVVRFPLSQDITWKSAPKFAVGETPTLLLQRDRIGGNLTSAMVSGVRVPVFTALDAADALKASDADLVRSINRLLNGR